MTSDAAINVDFYRSAKNSDSEVNPYSRKPNFFIWYISPFTYQKEKSSLDRLNKLCWAIGQAQQALLYLAPDWSEFCDWPITGQAQQSLPNWPTNYKFAYWSANL